MDAHADNEHAKMNLPTLFSQALMTAVSVSFQNLKVNSRFHQVRLGSVIEISNKRQEVSCHRQRSSTCLVCPPCDRAGKGPDELRRAEISQPCSKKTYESLLAPDGKPAPLRIRLFSGQLSDISGLNRVPWDVLRSDPVHHSRWFFARVKESTEPAQGAGQ